MQRPEKIPGTTTLLYYWREVRADPLTHSHKELQSDQTQPPLPLAQK